MRPKAKPIKHHEDNAVALLSNILKLAKDSELLFREYRFHPKRKWRFDIALPDKKIAIEVEGGTWIRGRHIHPIGYANDCEKYNEATRMGWTVYRLVPSMLTKEYLEHLLLLPSDQV